eukprot:TRINITY_DN12984_c0_g1_i1.p1 TRINITY_DN12984_c0_g1~~TRINITY_DN12984_c0_g1_i1.p1  ORF type:complete len:654 (+),score=156.68 TRINITY_DN12984_c0_g1_i1:48-2009(+)
MSTRPSSPKSSRRASITSNVSTTPLSPTHTNTAKETFIPSQNDRQYARIEDLSEEDKAKIARLIDEHQQLSLECRQLQRKLEQDVALYEARVAKLRSQNEDIIRENITLKSQVGQESVRVTKLQELVSKLPARPTVHNSCQTEFDSYQHASIAIQTDVFHEADPDSSETSKIETHQNETISTPSRFQRALYEQKLHGAGSWPSPSSSQRSAVPDLHNLTQRRIVMDDDSSPSEDSSKVISIRSGKDEQASRSSSETSLAAQSLAGSVRASSTQVAARSSLSINQHWLRVLRIQKMQLKPSYDTNEREFQKQPTQKGAAPTLNKHQTLSQISSSSSSSTSDDLNVWNQKEKKDRPFVGADANSQQGQSHDRNHSVESHEYYPSHAGDLKSIAFDASQNSRSTVMTNESDHRQENGIRFEQSMKESDSHIISQESLGTESIGAQSPRDLLDASFAVSDITHAGNNETQATMLELSVSTAPPSKQSPAANRRVELRPDSRMSHAQHQKSNEISVDEYLSMQEHIARELTAVESEASSQSRGSSWWEQTPSFEDEEDLVPVLEGGSLRGNRGFGGVDFAKALAQLEASKGHAITDANHVGFGVSIGRGKVVESKQHYLATHAYQPKSQSSKQDLFTLDPSFFSFVEDLEKHVFKRPK